MRRIVAGLAGVVALIVFSAAPAWAAYPFSVSSTPAGATVTFDAAWLHYSEISLIGSFHYRPEEAREAMRMLSSGEIDPAPLVTDRGGLSDLPRFLAAESRREGIRHAVFP